MSTSDRKISKEKGVQLCAEMIFSGKKTGEIAAILAENYGTHRSTVEKWMPIARPIAKEMERKANEVRNTAIEAQVMESAQKVVITREAAEARLWSIFNVNLQDYFTKNGNLINIKDLPRDKAGLLASIEIDELYHGVAGQRYWVGQTKKIKPIDALRAFEILAKMKGWMSGEGNTTINNLIIGYGKEVPV